MEGGELFAKISDRATPFTEQEVARVMHQICAAVKHLHDLSIVKKIKIFIGFIIIRTRKGNIIDILTLFL